MGAGGNPKLLPGLHRHGILPIAPEEGVVVTDISFRPIAMDRGATEILRDINRDRGMGERVLTIPVEIVAALQRGDFQDSSRLRIQVRGEIQTYGCRAYLMEPRNRVLTDPVVTLHFQRVSSASDAIHKLSVKGGLTRREEEVLTGISTGMTSKELAERMNISPNTVKTYLRLIMMKLDVTTRAAIVGKLLNYDEQ